MVPTFCFSLSYEMAYEDKEKISESVCKKKVMSRS
jgi:hypothetical protein